MSVLIARVAGPQCLIETLLLSVLVTQGFHYLNNEHVVIINLPTLILNGFCLPVQ